MTRSFRLANDHPVVVRLLAGETAELDGEVLTFHSLVGRETGGQLIWCRDATGQFVDIAVDLDTPRSPTGG